MNKKCKIFLRIGFAIFIFSIIAFILGIISSYFKIKADFPDDNAKIKAEFVFTLFFAPWIICPFLASELSCIRSIYKILKYNPKGVVKICYIVSSVLAFISIIFQCLVSAGVLDFNEIGVEQNATFYILLPTECVLFILSFALGSVCHKQSEQSVVKTGDGSLEVKSKK